MSSSVGMRTVSTVGPVPAESAVMAPTLGPAAPVASITSKNMHDTRNGSYACLMQTSPFVLTEPIPVPDTAEDALMSLMMALGRRMRQRQPGDAIDYSAFPILKLLSHQGPMRLSALAQVLGLDASTVSRHARQLEDRGLLERTEDP